MGKTKLDETYISKISIKMRFFWCSYWYLPFFRVLVTIELGRSLLQFITMNCDGRGHIFEEQQSQKKVVNYLISDSFYNYVFVLSFIF